ncbi:hypothetical protein SBRCBS47491_010017 [Sporothrix bragantina]|uniref:Hydroxyacylglutathione hydrolase n=1 Tax=Sporothrix bragantina TaxID=671064 RepID=A0ABP0D2C5_9PEZI
MGDVGTARCDFPGGSAKDLYRSGRKLLDNLPGHVKIWTGHDYPPADTRKDQPMAYLTVDEHNARNKHLADGVIEEEYVSMRTARDKTMGAPRLLHQSLQINIRGGRMPQPTQAGLRLMHLPIQGGEW